MPAINANIVVEQTTLTLSPTTTQIGVTVDPINLGIFTTSPTPIGGNIGQLQYNVNGAQFGGVANTSVASGNLTFTNLANLKIDGGTNAYYLQTDGAGGLTWAAGGTPTGSGVPSGANTQIQLSDGSGSFASGAGFTFDNASNVFSTPGRAIVAGNIDTTAGIFNGDGGGISNIQPANIVGLSLSEIANATSNVNISTADGNIEFAVNGANIVRMSKTNLPYPALVKIEGNVTTEGDITINPGAIFIGDGGGLSNLNVTSGSQITNGTSNVDIVAVDGNVVVGVNGVADRLIVTDIGLVGDGYGISNIAVSNIVGLSLSSISNGTSNINISASGPEEIEFVVGGADVGSFVNTGASPYPGFLTVNGNVLAYRDIETVSGSLIGNGNGISNIQGANVSGAVAFATTANAVAGANVSGTVANAVYAADAGNTTGSANYAAYAGNIVAAYAQQPNITQVGILSGLQFVGNLQSFGSGNISGINRLDASVITATSNLNVTGNIIVANGNVDVSAGTYTGDGYGLANLTGANVSGAVANATFAVSSGTTGAIGPAVILPAVQVAGKTNFNPFAGGTYNWDVSTEGAFIDATSTALGADFFVQIALPGGGFGTSEPYIDPGDAIYLSMLVTNSGTNTFKLNNYAITGATLLNTYYFPSNPIVGYTGTSLYEFTIQRLPDNGFNEAYNVIINVKDLA